MDRPRRLNYKRSQNNSTVRIMRNYPSLFKLETEAREQGMSGGKDGIETKSFFPFLGHLRDKLF